MPTNCGEQPDEVTAQYTGAKRYELSDHLGNVLALISDKKLENNWTGSKEVDQWLPDVVEARDYYAFGGDIVGRSYNSTGQSGRYGFNGKEEDNEAVGSSVYDYGFRIYNPALGKFLSVDPLAFDYPWNSPYSFAENDVVRSIDLDGLEKVIQNEYYDKYGRLLRTHISGIREKDSRHALELAFETAVRNKLTTQDVYIIRRRNESSRSIFFEGPGGRLSDGLHRQVATSATVGAEEDNDLPENTIQYQLITGRGRFLKSAYHDETKDEFFEGITQQNRLSRIRYSSGRIMADFVGGSYSSNNQQSKSAGLSPNTLNSVTAIVNDFVEEFKTSSRSNVAFVESIQITLNNNDYRTDWDRIRRQLISLYGARVTIVINSNLQQNSVGAPPIPGTRVSGTLAQISYTISGVKDGNTKNASNGNQ